MPNLLDLIHSQDISLPTGAVEKIQRFGELVVQYNKKANLISSGDEAKIASRHLLDSLQPVRFLSKIFNDSPFPTTWADMGSGAGFPVIPLCIALPQVQLKSIEPRQKRHTFLKVVRSELKLENLTVIGTNVNDSKAEGVDCVSCRALGSIEEDWAMASSLLRPGGVFVTLKSLRDCQGLSAVTWNIIPYELPGESLSYCLLSRKKDHG